MRPVIGLIPLVDIQRDSYWMLPGYMKGIASAGGIPIMLPLTADIEALDRLTGLCDGFLFTGGQDISPDLYGETASEALGERCRRRDEMELPLLLKAIELDKPVLGICRGLQFINVALGGTLYQDLPSQLPSRENHRQNPPYHLPSHSVQIQPGTPLHKLLRRDTLQVNSLHHQGVRDLSERLMPMASAADGLVEAACMPDKKFVWAVQWHPEFSYQADENSRKLFDAFVRGAR